MNGGGRARHTATLLNSGKVLVAKPDEAVRFLAAEISALVQQFRGSIAAEHGVGIARTQFMPEQLGPDLMDLMTQVKNSFDPHNLFNPGKIIADGRYEIDADLRTRTEQALPFEPVLAFAAKDESFIGNLEHVVGGLV